MDGADALGTAWGALIDSAPDDWTLIQRGEGGTGRMDIAGRWAAKEGFGIHFASGGQVQARLVSQESGAPPEERLDWRTADTRADGTWSMTLEGIPAGGPYRLETRFNPRGNKLGEWSLRGDMRHFLSVGDIWIVAGQSNAVGYGRAPAADGPEFGLHVLRHNGRWALAAHPLHDATGTVFPANRETYNAGHSPFLHFARILRRETGLPIGLIPAALGGSPLEAWHPGRGPLFRNLLDMVRRAGGRVAGMAWCQGESDSEPGLAETYLERFLESVDGWRQALGRPDLPILTVQLGRYHGRDRSAGVEGHSAGPASEPAAGSPATRRPPAGKEDEEWSRVREAQRAAAALRKQLAVVPALDLPLDDTIHFGTAGNLILADRLARCALGLAYGRSVEHRAPDILEAVMRGDQVLELRFGPVTGRLDSYRPVSNPFRVEDEAGPATVERTVYYRRDTVRLYLSRPCRGAVRVSCGYGEDPDVLPVDTGRLLPILARLHVPATF